jgi:hypothetical protein
VVFTKFLLRFSPSFTYPRILDRRLWACMSLATDDNRLEKFEGYPRKRVVIVLL